MPAKDLFLEEKIKECQEKHGKTYGYRRVRIWLERQGIHHNPKTILRIMQKYNLLSEVRRKNIVITVMLYINTIIFLIEIFVPVA